MGYVRMVNSLWRRKRSLQVLNVAANAAAMTLVFVLLEAMAYQSLQSDPSAPVGVVVICVACAAAVTKIVSDHTFTSQWEQLMCLRVTGASPIRLFGAVVACQSVLAVCAGLVGVLLGIVLNKPLRYVFNGFVVIPQASIPAIMMAALATMVLSVICCAIGAGLSALTLIRAIPDPSARPVKTGKKRKTALTVVLVLLLVVSCVSSLFLPYTVSLNLTFVLSVLLAWVLIRVAKPILTVIAGRMVANYHRRHGAGDAGLILAFREMQATRSTSLVSLLAVASVLLAFLYSLYGYTQADAQSSLNSTMASTSVVQVSHAGIPTRQESRDLMDYAKMKDSNALALAPSTVVQEESMKSNCSGRIESYDRGNAKAVINGSLNVISPNHSIVSGDVNRQGVVISAIVADNNGLDVGSRMCVVQGGKTFASQVVAITKTASPFKDYMVVGYDMPGLLDKADTAIIADNGKRTSEDGESSASSKTHTVGASITVTPAAQWIRNIPSGKAMTTSGGDGVKEAAPIVFPVLAVCFLGAVSVMFDMVQERKKITQAAWLIGFGPVRYALASAGRIAFEGFAATLCGGFGTVLIVNMALHSESRMLVHGISGYVPIRAMAVLLCAVLLISLIGFIAHFTMYQRLDDVRNQ
ncbi:hypothetical protein OZX72_05075 [Bifidobacterium sp. ESL0769]|uniref:hypothetical protein n=1 Tax=Bifidobacterium sp. ESL0769 TaxID=2983229 RepID=UPI0023F8BA82|nr:hypothetical protein [Bifidobacterium sp. ESL0769]WEV68342.1 hypothetical protein OZX72_05075 [Bifidobacterium sp. ESL0769]